MYHYILHIIAIYVGIEFNHLTDPLLNLGSVLQIMQTLLAFDSDFTLSALVIS